jgi:hypothetical protein
LVSFLTYCLGILPSFLSSLIAFLPPFLP